MALGLIGKPATLDWAVGAQGELAGGSIPISIEDAVAPAAEAYFELRTGMRLLTPTETFVLLYTPRLFGRLPGTEQLGRPLLLHTLSTAFSARLAPRLTLDLRGTGSVGEVAYSRLQRVFVPGTGAVPASTVALMTGDLEATTTFQSTLRNTVRVALRGGAQTTPSFYPTAEGQGVPEFTMVGGEVADDYRVNRIDTVSALGSTAYYRSPNQGEIYLFGAEGAFARRLGPASRIRVQGGAVAARSPAEGRPTVFPTSSASYSTAWGTRFQPWTTAVTGGVQGFFDALSFDYRPVAFVSSELATVRSPAFRTGAHLSAFTSLTSRPAETALFETVINLALPSSYALSEQVDLLFGARASLFGPHLSELSSERAQTQVLLFVGFQHHEGTGQTRGSWLN